MNRTRSLVLITIVALALGLRIWGIGFGLPYPYHVDEPTYVSAALNLGAGIIGRQPNPTGFSNILFAEYAAYYLIGHLTGLFESTAAFEQAYRSDPSVFLLLSRLTSALLGTATVLVIFWLSDRSKRRITGWLAALFLAVSFAHVRDSHYGVPDVPTTFFVSLAVLFAVMASQKQHIKYLGLAAAAAGYAVATKWSVWPVGIPVLIATVYSFRQRARVTQAAVSKQLAGLFPAAIGLVGGFAIGGFQLLLKPTTYIEYALREAQAGEAGGFGFWQIDTLPGWLFYLKTLLYGLGIVLLVLGLLGLTRRLVMSVTRRDSASIVVVSFPLIYFLIMGSTQHYFARYALPLVPFFALFAAEAIGAARDWLVVKHQAWTGAAIGILVIGALVVPMASNVQHDVLLTRLDTRTLAKNWIEANLPAGVKIAADWPMHTPALSTADQSVPGDSGKSYDVTYIGGSGLADHTLDWYRQQGYTYLIASSFIYNIPLVFPKQDAERNAFYTSLQQQLTLVKAVSPTTDGSEPPFIFDEIYGPVVSLWQRELPGPTIKIYQLPSK